MMSRRRFLSATGLVVAPVALAGCGFKTSDSSSTGKKDTLAFTTWGTDSELAGLRRSISRFEKAKQGAKVALNVVPYEQMFTNIDAQLQADEAPDIFRVPYYTFGSYAGRGQLLDLSSHLADGFGDRFTPAAWAAVQNQRKPYGVPHHTDTSVILYNKAAFRSAGITSVPTSLDRAWTWQEFTQVAKTLRAALPKDKFPMVYNWQGNGVTRWLSWLFEADGRFLAEDLTTPAIDSAAGRAAVDYTKAFFANRFVPPSSSVKSATYASDVWYAQTAAMTWSGAFLVPDATKTLDFEWGATYSPRRQRGAGDFGGNALVATAKTGKPELAASFLDFMTREAAMRDFCANASLLPTRRDLVEEGIRFKVRPELSPVFVGQATTVRPADSGQVASPNMSAIITVLQNELEKAFIGGQSTADTVKGLSAGIAAATKR